MGIARTFGIVGLACLSGCVSALSRDNSPAAEAFRAAAHEALSEFPGTDNIPIHPSPEMLPFLMPHAAPGQLPPPPTVTARTITPFADGGMQVCVRIDEYLPGEWICAAFTPSEMVSKGITLAPVYQPVP